MHCSRLALTLTQSLMANIWCRLPTQITTTARVKRRSILTAGVSLLWTFLGLSARQQTGWTEPVKSEVDPARYDDYVRYLQAFHKASVSNERLHCDMTAFTTLEPEKTKHGAELRKDAPRPNAYDVGERSDWFQSLTSMNLILTHAGAKRRHEIKQSAELADEE